MTVFEGGTKTAAFVYSPNEKFIPESRRGSTSDALGHVTDLFPTFLDLAGPHHRGPSCVVPFTTWRILRKREMPVHYIYMYMYIYILTANLLYADGTLGENKPLDGVDLWSAWTGGDGQTSPRKEMLYNIDPQGKCLTIEIYHPPSLLLYVTP